MRQKPPTDDLPAGYLANVSRVRASSFYRDALARAESSPEVVAELGQPLEADLHTGGIKSVTDDAGIGAAVTQLYLAKLKEMVPEANHVGAEQFAHIAVVLRGPKGQGKLILVASGVGESWSFHKLFVSIEGREAPISLLAGDG